MTKLSFLAVFIALLLLISTATSQPQAARKPTVFSTLKVGQAVALNEKELFVKISIIDGIDQGTHKIIEVGEDFIALQDIADVTEVRIPVHAVKWVVRIKSKVEQD